MRQALLATCMAVFISIGGYSQQAAAGNLLSPIPTADKIYIFYGLVTDCSNDHPPGNAHAWKRTYINNLTEQYTYFLEIIGSAVYKIFNNKTNTRP